MGGVAVGLVAVVLVAPGPARRPPWAPLLEVSLRSVPGARATVDVEIRNAAREAIEVPIVATLWLRPPVQPDGSRPPESSALSSAFDPVAGVGADGPRGQTELRLPVRGACRARVNLETLGWSLSPPLYVWVPRPLSQVTDYAEYDLSLHVMVVEGRFWASVQSKPLRVRLGSR